MLYTHETSHSREGSATATAPISQINVRIERSSKEAGDKVIARAGTTPSKVVRELWQHLAEQDSPEDAIALTERSVREAVIDREPTPIQGRLVALDRMYGRFTHFGEAWGLDVATLPDNSRDDLRAAVRAEKQATRSYEDAQ